MKNPIINPCKSWIQGKWFICYPETQETRDGADTACSWLTTQVTHYHSLKRGRILQGSHNSCFNQEKSHHCLDPSLRKGIFSGGKGREGQGCRCATEGNKAPFYLQWRGGQGVVMKMRVIQAKTLWEYSYSNSIGSCRKMAQRDAELHVQQQEKPQT